MTETPSRAPFSVGGMPPAAFGLLMLAPLFMASNVVFGRAAVEVMPPVALAFWRWLTAFFILLPIAGPGLWRHRRVLMAGWKRLLLLGSLGMGVCGAFVYIGLQTTTATNGGLIYAISPILIILLAAIVAHEGLRWNQIVGVAVALSGVVVILTRGHPEALLQFRFTVGDLWILGSAGSWAVYTVILRASFKNLPTLVLFAAIILAGVISLAPFAVWEGTSGSPVILSRAVLISVAGIALFSSVLAFACFQKGVATVGSGRAGPFMYLMPIYSALLAMSLLGESFEAFHAIGLGLILPGVAVASLVGRR